MTSVLDRFLTPKADLHGASLPATAATPQTLHGFTIEELKALAHPSEWEDLVQSPEALVVFARSLKESRQLQAGERPDRFDCIARCMRCGPIWVPAFLEGGSLGGCRWCERRRRVLPIPRPPVVCAECEHWQQGGVGSCAVNAEAFRRHGVLRPEAAASCIDWCPRGQQVP